MDTKSVLYNILEDVKFNRIIETMDECMINLLWLIKNSQPSTGAKASSTSKSATFS